MYNVSIKFPFKDEELMDLDIMHNALKSFVNNGQLIEFFHHPVIRENMAVYNGIMIQADSLDAKYYNENTKRFLGLLKENETEFEYELVPEGESLAVQSLADASALILYQGGESPLRSLDNFLNIPLYLLPPTSPDGTNYFNIITWERNYEAIYRIWFRGEVDEPYFFDQLINFQSDLSKQGMAICKQISDLTKKRCYYYLYRYPDPDAKEVENCPRCNSAWKMENELFDTFKYRCDNCFLIS